MALSKQMKIYGMENRLKILIYLRHCHTIYGLGLPAFKSMLFRMSEIGDGA